MTFSDLQVEVSDRLNLTSTQALTRIGRSINERYRWLVSSIGLEAVQRTTATATTTIGNRSLTFGPTPTPVEKILALYNTAYTPPMVLDEVTMDTLRNSLVGGDPPTQYAIQTFTSNSVTVFLSSSPATQYVLTADVLSNTTTLSGVMVPAFPEDFHDCLVYGAMATEYAKMEKPDLAEVHENYWTQRVSDLRMYLAKSAYLTIVQGKNQSEAITQWPPLLQ